MEFSKPAVIFKSGSKKSICFFAQEREPKRMLVFAVKSVKLLILSMRPQNLTVCGY